MKKLIALMLALLLMFDGTARPYVLAYGDEFSSLPSCGVGGPNAQSAEAEKILSCGADIVFSEYEDVEKADALQEQLGVPVITLKTGVGGVFDPAFSDSIALLGTVLGRQTRSQELIAYVQAQTAEIQSRTADIEDADKPSVYVCGLGDWGTTNHLVTAPSYISFEIANVKNVLGDMPLKGVQPIDEEKFVSVGEDTDIIIMDAAAIKNIIPLYRESPDMFEVCRAWREGRVYLQMAYNAYYTNYETALINTWFIAKTVYPDRFEDIDIDEKADEVTTAFLGMPLTEKIKSCPNSFGGWGRIEPDMFMG